MASDNPFANLGLGMMGGDVGYARQMSTPEGNSKIIQKLLGSGLDWLSDQFTNSSKPDGSVPPSSPVENTVVAPKPMAPVDYGFSGSFKMPSANTPVVPYSQVAPVTAEPSTTATQNNLPTIGGYRKFLRPQGFGNTAE